MATAAELLAELRKNATAQLNAAKLAAKHEGLALVDAARLEQLEALAVAVAEAAKTATMTRDYRDAIKAGKVKYLGKRYLVDRSVGDEVLRIITGLKPRISGPQGWAVP